MSEQAVSPKYEEPSAAAKRILELEHALRQEGPERARLTHELAAVRQTLGDTEAALQHAEDEVKAVRRERDALQARVAELTPPAEEKP